MVKIRKLGELIITEILVLGVPVMTYARRAKSGLLKDSERRIFSIENS